MLVKELRETIKKRSFAYSHLFQNDACEYALKMLGELPADKNIWQGDCDMLFKKNKLKGAVPNKAYNLIYTIIRLNDRRR